MILVRVSGVSVCQMVYGGMVGTHILHTHNSCTTTCTHRGVPVYTYVCVSWLVFLHDVGS